MIADIKSNVAREFDDYMETTLAQVKDTISPVDRFCRAEQDELEQANQALAGLTKQLEQFQRSISTEQ